MLFFVFFFACACGPAQELFAQEAQLSRLAQERRDAGLTAARQALHSYQGYQEDALTAFPLTPAAERRKQVYRAFALTARKRPRRTPRAPTRRQRTPATPETSARAPEPTPDATR